MRIVMGSAHLLMTAVQPALCSEAFVTQVTNRTVAPEPVAASAAKPALVPTMLALPVKPGALNQFVQAPAAVPGANISSVAQSGTNNFVAINQTGGGNASSIVQRGGGNQAVVMQRH